MPSLPRKIGLRVNEFLLCRCLFFQTRHLPAIAPLSQGRLAKIRRTDSAAHSALDFVSKVGLAMKASVSCPQLVVCMVSKTRTDSEPSKLCAGFNFCFMSAIENSVRVNDVVVHVGYGDLAYDTSLAPSHLTVASACCI